MSEFVWIAIAYSLGLLARQCGVPSLIGYLLAGFCIKSLDIDINGLIKVLADLGVLLLLFTIGLKTRIRNVIQLENWGGGSFHLVITSLIFAPIFHVAAAIPWNIAVLLSIALGFSSTVVAASALEERRELRAFHGRVAIGILVFQDIIAVMLMSYLSGDRPSIWSFSLLLLPLLRPMLHKLLHLSGHDELLVLFGLMLALVLGGEGFSELGLNPELGAIVFGALLSDHAKSKELADALNNLKEVMLVGFFIQIGLSGLPSLENFGYALLLVCALPLKAVIFFTIMLRFKLRSRSSFLASLSLCNYSEFGLIIAHLATQQGLLPESWLLSIALTVAISFAISAPLNRYAHEFYEYGEKWLTHFELAERHPDDEPLSLGYAQVLIFGMGRIGTGAYDFLTRRHVRVIGLDSDPGKIELHLNAHRRVLYADAEDPGFWKNLNMEHLRAVLLTMPDLQAKKIATKLLRQQGFKGIIGATTKHIEDAKLAQNAGMDMTFNIFDEAGVGLAEHVWEGLYPKNSL